MIISQTIAQIREEITKVGSQKIAFVPTMGSLHQGHLALVKEAKKYADVIIVSIFVNKAQFNDKTDYDLYPRNVDSDIALLKESGATHLFVPQERELLPEDLSYNVVANSLCNCLCGATRPGHFDGVSLILSKFFNIINPDFAIFGKKDFQQYLIVKKLVKDLNYKTNIVGVEAVREKSGLVMSSRNERLNSQQKDLAQKISVTLCDIKKSCLEKPNHILEILEQFKDKILRMGFEKIDYLEIRSEEDLSIIKTLDPVCISSRIFIAVYVGQIRLIDNVAIS